METIQKQRSPFICGKIIKDPNQFWGRKSELYQIMTRLQNMESISIVGDRRIGKSSIAYYIFSTANINFDDSYTFVWLDGQSNHTKSIKDFCSELTKRGSIEYVPSENQKDCLINFEDAVLESKKKLVIIINEFELLTDEKRQEEFDPSFFHTLRLLAEQGNCAIITTSKEPLQDLCKHVLGISSPFYNIFLEVALSDFTSEEAQGFLELERNGFKLTEKEISIVKSIPNYRHPLTLQIACHNVFLARTNAATKGQLIATIRSQSLALLNHDDVVTERIMSKNKEGKSISKPLDLALSIFIPILGLGLLMWEFAFLIGSLSLPQAVLLAIFSALVGFAVIVFAGRSIDIIGETTFFKLFTRIIAQIPLLSNILSTITEAIKKSKK